MVELLVSMKFCHEWAMHQHFFLDELLGWWEVVAANIVALVDCGVPWALAVVFTRVSLGFRLVWGAFLFDEMAVLRQEPVEDCPTSRAPFIQIVTHQHELGRKLRNLLMFVRILESKASLDGLDEPLRVTGSTLTLVTKRPSEIVAAQVSEIVLIRNKRVRDFVWTLVLTGPFLSFGNHSGKLICILPVGGVSGSFVFDELLPTSFLSEKFRFNKSLLCSGLG